MCLPNLLEPPGRFELPASPLPRARSNRWSYGGERETGFEPANLIVGNDALYRLSYSRVISRSRGFFHGSSFPLKPRGRWTFRIRKSHHRQPSSSAVPGKHGLSSAQALFFFLFMCPSFFVRSSGVEPLAPEVGAPCSIHLSYERVRPRGFEPLCSCERQPLKLMRLPVSPGPRVETRMILAS